MEMDKPINQLELDSVCSISSIKSSENNQFKQLYPQNCSLSEELSQSTECDQSALDASVPKPSFWSLNDDCVLEILKYVECEDLDSIADLSSRLQGLARMVFVSKWKGCVTLHHGCTQRARNIIHNFAPLIKSIRLLSHEEDRHFEMHSECIVHLMSQYCEGQLRSLEIHWFNFSHWNFLLISDINRSLFAGLETLILKHCVIPIDMLAACQGLTELALVCTEVTNDYGQYQHLYLENVKRLTMIKVDNKRGLGLPHFAFIRRPDKLEYLETDSSGKITSKLKILQILNRSDSHWSELELHECEDKCWMNWNYPRMD